MTDLNTALKIYSAGYNDLPYLRTAISTLPFIGSQLDFLLSTPGQKFMEERVEYLINQLEKEIAKLQEDSIDKNYLKTEEGYDLINKTFAIAARTRQRKKLDFLAKILKGAIVSSKSSNDPEFYVKLIDELNEKELEIALLIYKVKTQKEQEKKNEELKDESTGMSAGDPHWISKNYPQFSKDELQYILPRLEKTGLIKELVGSYMGYGGESYKLTQLIHDFVNFIEYEIEK